MNKNILQPLKVITLAAALSLGLSFAYAWTAPTTTPPGGNTAAPLNVSGTSQLKNGALGVDGWLSAGGIFHGYSDLYVDGNMKVGTTTSALLDVSGIVKATGLQLPTGASAGKVLTSDASGNASWGTGGGAATSDPGTLCGLAEKTLGFSSGDVRDVFPCKGVSPVLSAGSASDATPNCPAGYTTILLVSGSGGSAPNTYTCAKN